MDLHHYNTLHILETHNIFFSYTGKIYALNDYFSSIANVDDKDTNLQSYFSSFDEIVIQENEIVDVISILPVNKAVGPDCISYRMLKTAAIAVSKPLCILFNVLM